jgi:hypothetical protein
LPDRLEARRLLGQSHHAIRSSVALSRPKQERQADYQSLPLSFFSMPVFLAPPVFLAL